MQDKCTVCGRELHLSADKQDGLCSVSHWTEERTGRASCYRGLILWAMDVKGWRNADITGPGPEHAERRRVAADEWLEKGCP